MAEERNPFPQPNAIRNYTQAELVRRKAGAQAVPNPTSMPFVRFTSTKVDDGEASPKAYKFFHMGLHGIREDDAPDEFGNIFEMTYGGQDVVGYAFGEGGNRVPITSTDSKLTKDLFPDAKTNPANLRESQPAEGRHPVPGVTNVSVRHMGVNEPIQTTVEWICYNQTQLEFLRQHFLMAGGYVVVEFGNYWSNREPPPLFDFGTSHSQALFSLTGFVTKGRKHMSDILFEPARGNYNMVIGRVVDQSISFQSDGTIHCSTTFYSTGEAVFGVHNTRLLSGVSTEEGSERFSLTINQFFSDNGALDKLLVSPEIEPFVVELRARNAAEIRQLQGEDATEEQLEALKSRYDSTFIPWHIFIRQVMVRLFQTVATEGVSADAMLFTEINLDEPEIGNHHLLASTDPDTLVIVKSFMLRGGQTSEEEIASGRVDVAATFVRRQPGDEHQTLFKDATGGEEKGLLSNGIWLNVGAIKDSFTQSNTFYQGFMALLTRMNNATENYWHLDLAFDEETQQYKIYDKKCVFGDGESFPEPYIFNHRTLGELLELSFEANFSKESKTAILLASQPTTRAEAIEKMSIDGFNQPSVWTEVMNLPDLKDELGASIHADRTAVGEALPGQDDFTVTGNVQRSGAADRHEDRRKAEAEAEAARAPERKVRASRLARFGDPIGPYMATPTQLVAAIAEDGRQNPKQINNFVAPIPTEINLSMTLQGINGLAFYDTFLVDKLPRIYEDHGVFLINEIQHSVTPSGWTTTIGGLFYFVDLAGKGQPSTAPITFTEDRRSAGEVVGTGTFGDQDVAGEQLQELLAIERATRKG